MSIVKMDANGRMIIKMDANGSIRLPAELIDKLDLNEDCEFALDWNNDGTIIIKKLGCRARFEKWLSNGSVDGEDMHTLSL